MATHGCIARLNHKGKVSGFHGVFHYWDSNPETLGVFLYHIRNTEFNGNTEEMLKFIIDDNPAGWATLMKNNNGDIILDRTNFHIEENNLKDDGCEAHDEEIHTANAYKLGIEYVYAFYGNNRDIMKILGLAKNHPYGNLLYLNNKSNSKHYCEIGEIDMNGPEPIIKYINVKDNNRYSITQLIPMPEPEVIITGDELNEPFEPII